MLQKIRLVFLVWQKRPKTIVNGIIVHDDKSESNSTTYKKRKFGTLGVLALR